MFAPSITRGIKYFIVGLADTALKESKQRIYTAIKNTQFHWPGQRITINLAPTTTRKFGTLLELPIALGVLAASGQFPTDRLEAYLIVGTLGLDGGVVPVEQPYQLLELAKRLGKKGVVLNTYSCQFVAPPVVQLKDAELLVTPVDAKLVGLGQVGAS